MSKSVKASLYEIYANLSKNKALSEEKKWIDFQEFVFQQAEK